VQTLYDIIANDPRFHALSRARARVAWSLLVVVCASYYAFILTIALAPGLFAEPLEPGIHVTWGIVVGVAVIVLSIASTGIYAWLANRRFDRLNALIVRDAEQRATPR
jgi:uncharacterized membrane protein (DUF485 family)